MLLALLLSLVLPAGTPLSNTAPRVVAAAVSAPGEPSDITSPGIDLGAHWWGFESYQGKSFRWVDNDAIFTIKAPTARLVYVKIRAEGGPGLGTTTFPLRVLDGKRRQVDAVFVTAEAPEQTLVLPVAAGQNVFMLHVDGGGKPTPHDRRVLNFRVFALTYPGAKQVTAAAGSRLTFGIETGSDETASLAGPSPASARLFRGR